jgi:anti-sigma regulatory factor (Ser/Thr protein kinase)
MRTPRQPSLAGKAESRPVEVKHMEVRHLELNFPGTLVGFEQAFARLRDELDAANLSAGTRYNIELVFEEIVANIVRHGSDPERAVAIHVALEVGGESIVLTFLDDGVPFDPRERTDPIAPKSLEDATVGGLGLMLVRRAATGLEYCRTADQNNRLVVVLAGDPHVLS